MTNVAKFMLFLSSFSPLLAILSFREFDRDEGLALGYALAALILALILPALMLLIYTSSHPEKVKLGTVKRADTEILAFAITYFLPFLEADFTSRDNLWTFILLYLVISVTFVRANAIHVNPLFNVFGFSLFDAEEEGGNAFILISRRNRVATGEDVTIRLDSQSIFAIEDTGGSDECSEV